MEQDSQWILLEQTILYKEGLFLMAESHWTLLANLEQDLHFFPSGIFNLLLNQKHSFFLIS